MTTEKPTDGVKMKSIAELMCDVAKHHGVTSHEDIGAAAGVSQQAVSKWLRPTHPTHPRPKNVAAFCEHYKITMSELLSWDSAKVNTNNNMALSSFETKLILALRECSAEQRLAFFELIVDASEKRHAHKDI